MAEQWKYPYWETVWNSIKDHCALENQFNRKSTTFTQCTQFNGIGRIYGLNFRIKISTLFSSHPIFAELMSWLLDGTQFTFKPIKSILGEWKALNIRNKSDFNWKISAEDTKTLALLIHAASHAWHFVDLHLNEHLIAFILPIYVATHNGVPALVARLYIEWMAFSALHGFCLVKRISILKSVYTSSYFKTVGCFIRIQKINYFKTINAKSDWACPMLGIGTLCCV